MLQGEGAEKGTVVAELGWRRTTRKSSGSAASAVRTRSR
jgi:hypothetical protein